MNNPFETEKNRHEGENEAAVWAWRMDRGLSAEEQDALFDWLAIDPKHSEFLNRQRGDWKRLDKLSAWRPEHSGRPNPDLLAPKPKPVVNRLFWGAMAAAAAFAVVFVSYQQISVRVSDSASERVAESKPEIRNELDDGSTIKLKEGAEVSVEFTDTERRVRLLKGEAFFIVAKDANRPFVVEVQGVDVSAIGTAFNVRFDAEAVEVLVAEGVVKVGSSSDSDGVAPELRTEPRLEAHERAIISLTSNGLVVPQVAVLSKGEIQRVLAWQHGTMTFASKPLAEIIEELNRLNDIQLTIVDSDLASEPFSGSLQSNNVEGFVSLLEKGYGVEATLRGSSEILLGKVVD
jgi:transmembrane sensor|tara:strand:+ start:148 stop:1188 length:1041 start_codon:yes stop_codon:yes gene_type:complete